MHPVSCFAKDSKARKSNVEAQKVYNNLLREVAIDDEEAFTQVKVTVKIALASGSHWLTNPTMLLDSTLRLSHEWLERGAAELLWLDDAKSFGLRVQPRPRQLPPPAEGTLYYDLEVDGKCNSYREPETQAYMTELNIRATRFLAAVKEAERKEEKETVFNIPILASAFWEPC